MVQVDPVAADEEPVELLGIPALVVVEGEVPLRAALQMCLIRW